MSAPNWCEPCGRYHSRDYEGCARRNRSQAATDSPVRENVDEDQLARIPEASDHGYVAGWRAGWQAAMDQLVQNGAFA